MKKWILATALLSMAPAATTFAHGFDLSIGLGGIHIGSGGHHHCESYGPTFVGPSFYVEPAVTCYAPPAVVVSQPPVVVQPSVVYAAPPVYAAPVYAAPPVVYAAPRVYGYPAGYGYAPAGYYYGR